ncbi:MAG TPA: GNAT family N-acetyltransferase [Burkholderiales bacterium]|nr:GNAT family N-acetyltransferase [Burkholderiales bacterium]
MADADLPLLQRFFEENPQYHLAVQAAPPGPNAAQEEFDSVPPSDWRFDKKWLLRFADAEGGMIGMADLIENLFVDGVWHIGLFIIARRLHGTGRPWYDALESWLRGQGCAWIRLGVVAGNSRAERFWQNCGYREVRKRLAVPMGEQKNDVRVMVKPLAGGSLREYLSAVARDRPE